MEIMEESHNQTSAFENYPFLTSEEFAEVCHHLDRRYCQATLGPVRRQWKLRVNTALLMAFTPLAEFSTYVQIIRPLDNELDDDGLSAQLDKLSFDAPGIAETISVDADERMVDEENDTSALRKPPVKQQPFGYVTYEIHLHPTYRAPCLWFKLNGLGPDEPAFDIDTVFRRLVPDQYKDALRSNGPIGGISIDHHPITGVPSFFVHPCLLGEAMSNFNCTKENYLMVWLGLVGGCVGLWAPKEMALS